MSGTYETYQAMADHHKALRAKYGVNCPRCSQVRPKCHPTILLPQQRCKVDGYRDPRPALTNEQHQAVNT